MRETKTYQVQLEITRTVTVDIAAPDASKAREKANNLEFDKDVAGEITHWVVKDVVEEKR